MKIVTLRIDCGSGSPIPILIRQSNIVNADRAVHLLLSDSDLSFQSVGFLDSGCFETENFFLHFLGHQTGKELQLFRFAGSYFVHQDFEHDMRVFCRCVYDTVVSQLQPECWNEWITNVGLEMDLIHTNWSCKTGSSVEFRVRFVGFDGDISVLFCNKNEANSIFIIVLPSPKWFEGLISINQAYRVCKRAEELSNAVHESKRRTMAGLIFVEQCQQEHRQIKSALRKLNGCHVSSLEVETRSLICNFACRRCNEVSEESAQGIWTGFAWKLH